jgi:hypothetical protein
MDVTKGTSPHETKKVSLFIWNYLGCVIRGRRSIKLLSSQSIGSISSREPIF